MKAKRFVRVRGLFLYPTIPSIIRVVTPDEDENFISIRHCEERSDVAISSTPSVILRSPVSFAGRRENLIQPLCHCEERSDVAISFFKNFKKEI